MSEKRFLVETEFKRGERTSVYEGNDRDRAIAITNFWDAKQNTFMLDRIQEQARVDSLPFEERLEIRLEAMVQYAYASLDHLVREGEHKQAARHALYQDRKYRERLGEI